MRARYLPLPGAKPAARIKKPNEVAQSHISWIVDGTETVAANRVPTAPADGAGLRTAL